MLIKTYTYLRPKTSTLSNTVMGTNFETVYIDNYKQPLFIHDFESIYGSLPNRDSTTSGDYFQFRMLAWCTALVKEIKSFIQSFSLKHWQSSQKAMAYFRVGSKDVISHPAILDKTLLFNRTVQTKLRPAIQTKMCWVCVWQGNSRKAIYTRNSHVMSISTFETWI